MNKNTKSRQQCLSLHCHALFAAISLATLLAGCAAPPMPRQVTQPAPAAPQPQRQAPASATQPQAITSAVPAPPSLAQPVPAAPASDKAAMLRNWVEQQRRLYRVAAPLLIANTELCPRHVRNLLGFTAKNRYSYSDAFADVAQSELGLEEQLRVMSVLPGSGAEQAGLQHGDILHAVEIEPLPQGPDAERASAAIIASELQGRDRVSLTVLRNGERMVLDIPLTPACAMVVDLGNTDAAGSFADGQRIMVTRGMLGMARSEEELAYVLAQQIARNILAQQAIPETAALIDRLHNLTPPATDQPAGVLPAALADNAPRTRELALYLLARAGYSIGGAPGFWQQLGTPPVPDEEFAALQSTVNAIKVRQQAGEPLVPEQL